MRWRRWAKWGLSLLLVAWFGIYVAWAPWYVGTRAIERRPERRDRDASTTPESLGLAYEELSFGSRDGTKLSAWWVPEAADRGSAVLLHGLNRSRGEMADKLGFLNGLGWNALLLDLRGHGSSGGDITTLGWYEREDALAAVEQARSRSRGPVVLWGVSLGAATATLAAPEDSGVAALVADSSFRTLPDTVAHHLQLFRRYQLLVLAPRWPTVDLLLFWMGRRGGFDPADVDVLAAAKRLDGRPSLFVCNSDDPRMPQQIAFDLHDAAGERSRVLVIPGDSHGGAWRAGTAAYGEAVRQILEEVSPVTSAGAAGEEGGVTSASRASGAGGFSE